MSELVVACKMLPDFDTLQILYFPAEMPSSYWHRNYDFSGVWDQVVTDQANEMRNLAIDCLKSPKSGSEGEEGRKRTTVRVIRLSSDHPHLDLGSVEVEEYEV